MIDSAIVNLGVNNVKSLSLTLDVRRQGDVHLIRFLFYLLKGSLASPDNNFLKVRADIQCSNPAGAVILPWDF